MRPGFRNLLWCTATVAIGFSALSSGCSNDTNTRQEEVAARGATVMPFDLNATHHIFEQTSTGGVETVRALSEGDTTQIGLIRHHLQGEAAKFSSGDFADPAAIHGQDMPGLATLAAAGERLSIEYEELPDGARITFTSQDTVVITAIHDWFNAQVLDHGTHASGH